jgi:hypothetical protein
MLRNPLLTTYFFRNPGKQQNLSKTVFLGGKLAGLFFHFGPSFANYLPIHFIFCGDLKHFQQFARTLLVWEKLTIFKLNSRVASTVCDALQTQGIQAQTKCVLPL